ncbi:MAG TPA: hypothetical protein VKN99_07315 [Polyangia bacterium]|nr:hypothetical protein [Polyangia bacterium]
MPRKPGRPPRESALDRTLNNIVASAAAEIAQAVRQNIADEVSRLVGGRGGGGGAAPRLGRKRRIIYCPVPGCGKPGGGPKWGWFCADHKDMPESEKEKARAATRARPRSVARRRGPRKK